MTEQPDMRLCVVVLNYRTAGMTLDCLDSLEPQVRSLAGACVVVVDNCSDDGSADVIERAIEDRGWGSWARLVRCTSNRGFSHGNNAGLQQCLAEAYLLLNSDTLVQDGALEALWGAMQQRPDAGIIGPRLQWPDGRPQVSAFRDMHPVWELIRAAGTGPITRLLRRFEVPMAVSDGPMEAGWVSFAACLIRREVIEDIGPMDEGYFMYFEDVDYCRRARAAGWPVLYWPAARVVHLRGGTSPVKTQAAARRRISRYYYESRSRYFTRFYGRVGLWAANVLWTAGHGVSLLRKVLGKPAHACRHEWRDIWINSLPTSHAGGGPAS